MASMERMNEIKVENDTEIVREGYFFLTKTEQEDMPPTFSGQKSRSESCMDLMKVEPRSCSETYLTSSHNENQIVDIKDEDCSVGEGEEEDPMPIPFTPMNPEYDNCMDFLKVKLGSCSETYVTSSHGENQFVDVKDEDSPVGEGEEEDPMPIPFTSMNPEYDMQCDEASPAKRPRLLPVNQVRENVTVSDSDEAENNASDTEDEEVGPHSLSRESPSSEPSSSWDYSTSTSEDEDTVGNVAGHQPQRTQWTLPPYRQKRVVHAFTGAPKGKSSEAAHVTRESTPLSVLMLFFAEIITLLVVETNRYYYEYLVNNDKDLSSQRYVTEGEMLVFLALTLQMGHTIQGRLEDYWTKLEQLCCPFYGQMMVRARYYHILRFLHFRDNNRNRVDRTDDKLWKIRDLFEILRANFSKYYNPSEHLAVDEVTVKFKGRTVFKPYILQKHKHFGIKLYKLCDSTGYTYDMDVYVDKDRQRTTQHLTATHTTVTNLTRRIEGNGYKLYMDSFFSSPDLFDDLAEKNIYCCGTVRLHRKGMPKNLKPKTLRLKRGDIRVRTRGDLTAVVWRDKKDMCYLTNMHDPPREGSYRDEHGNAIKPAIVADYNRHMGYADRADRMANNYTASRRTWKWTKKLFFHLLDLAILNSYILLSSCGGKKISHRDFRLTLIREMLAWAGHEPQPYMPVGRPAPASSNIGRLDTRHGKHWPGRNPTKRRCRVCSARGMKRTVMYKCIECDVALCVDRSCFADYHTKDSL